MADRYIRHGETYCGDGTSSAAATIAGGPGAWNDINILEGSAPAYGTLSAGNTVAIRSKDAAGVDITRTVSANITLGKSGVTEASPVTWVLDDGSVWPGINGTLTYDIPSGNYGVTWTDYNNLYAGDKKFRVVVSYTAYSLGNTWVGKPGIIRGLEVDTSATTGNGGYVYLNNVSYSVGHYINPSFKLGKYWANALQGSSYSASTLINPEIELTQATEGDPVFKLSINSHIDIQGGRLFGAGAIEGFVLLKEDDTSIGGLTLNGFEYPRVVKVATSAATFQSRVQSTVIDGLLGSECDDKYCSIDSRNDGLYPTLRATLPDSANTSWSYKVYPHGASKCGPAKIHLKKLYTLTAAAKTITLDFLSCDSMPTPLTNTYWIEMAYVDATTGEKQYLTTLDHAASTVSTSTAGWSGTSYGAVSLTKRKLSVTTPTSIKQDTVVEVNFYSTDASSTSDDIFFVDPDPEFS